MKLLPKTITISPTQNAKWLPLLGDFDVLSRFHRPIKRDENSARLSIVLDPAERRAIRKKRKIPPSEWAPKSRWLPANAAVAGDTGRPVVWRNETVAYIPPIMDAAFAGCVEEVIVCAAAQAAKTEMVYTLIGYTVDRRPGDWLIVFPSERDAADNAKDRLAPMFYDSPVLRQYMTPYADDFTSNKITLQNTRIYMGWATSPGRLANRPIPYIFLDEEDKYPPTSGKAEASPQNLAKKRARTFQRKRKYFRTSSPSIEAGPIWQALTKEAQVVFDYWVQCPHCGGYQKMAFKNIKWADGERDPRKIRENKDAWYECRVCDARWDDADRDEAVRTGQWRDREHGMALDAVIKNVKPSSIGFHIPAWISPFVKLWECAEQFLKGRNLGRTNWNEMKDFRNGFAAEPWETKESVRMEQTILSLADERPPGLVPGDNQVAALLAGIDVHGDDPTGRLDYEIRAFGYGHAPTTWSVRFGRINSLEALKTVLWEDKYTDADGHAYPVVLACIDAMGHRTAEIYDFCRRHNGIVPCRGRQTMSRNFTANKQDVYPGTNKAIPGGLWLYNHNTTFFKNKLAQMLKVSPGDPGCWYYNSGLDLDWALQMCAETVNPEKQIWENPSNKDNHAWDVSVLLLLAAEILDLWRVQPPQERKEEIKPARSKEKPDRTDHAGWLGRFDRPGWLGK